MREFPFALALEILEMQVASIGQMLRFTIRGRERLLFGSTSLIVLFIRIASLAIIQTNFKNFDVNPIASINHYRPDGPLPSSE